MNEGASSWGFTINVVGIDGLPGDMEGILVGIAEDLRDEDNTFFFSRGYKPTEQDRRLGLATYCLSLTSGWTAYGGVISCTIDDGALNLLLTPETANKLGVPEEGRFPLNIGEEEVARLAAALKIVFDVHDESRPRVSF